MGQIFGAIHRAQGATFPVRLMASPQRVELLKALKLSFPGPIETLADIDTGASTTCFDLLFAERLGLEYTGLVPIHTPSSGPSGDHRYAYDVSVGIGHGTNDPRAYTIEAIATELMSQEFGVLIGRDILNRCILNYNGPNGMFDLRF